MSDIGEKIIAAVRGVAARNPSFVYPNPGVHGAVDTMAYCVYVREGGPSCLVGCALWDLDLIDTSLEEHPYNTVGVDDLLVAWLDGVELDLDEIEWLRNVQSGQDAEKPWAEAVKWADSFREEMLQDW